ncbi:hypothetical protein [Alkalimonas mucilaginosa]|uniref:Uncharacterized protein n=1 Tax=Alkalimonas mucilaginosa TaxID=3057676 RepID=A0ABU7JJZ0_9GAMM|nr:hypothetical protein [Alkalimonas sp. MEB004]MEE2025746.1 hypothetical protein [Alkalimonas sp. MEB004]
MKLQLKLIFICSVLVLAACNKRPEIGELEARFYQHQAQFDDLTEIACAIIHELETPYFRYFIQTSMEQDPYLQQRLEQVKQDPNFQSQLEELDKSLLLIKFSGMTLQQHDNTDCSIYLPIWGIGFAGKGASISYSYNPAQLTEYNDEIFFKGDPDTLENSHFTKPLANGWYIEYKKYSSTLSRLREQTEEK